MIPDTQPTTNKTNLKFSFDLRIIVVLLAAIIVVMLLIWKPWAGAVSDRTIEVTGQTTVTATPDEFVFYPNYQFENKDKTAALADVSKKSDEVTAELKKMGVDEKKIKTSSSGYDGAIMPPGATDQSTYYLQLTVTVNNKELAQKVQDYLVTTTPTGSISPQATFSDEKRNQLEATARDEATKDARAKAEQSGRNLGFTVGKVKTVSDGTGFNTLPFSGRAMPPAEADSKMSSSLGIYPGENELPYSVTVVYYIR